MTTADHQHCASLLGAYALRALDPAEHEHVSRHLTGCDRCRSEATELQDAVHRLPATPAPPDELWPRIVDEVRRRLAQDTSDGRND